MTLRAPNRPPGQARRLLTLGAAALIALAHLPARAGEPARFADPAPPAAGDLPDAPPPPAFDQPERTFRAAPKPLPAGAVTEDWPAFLGPRHDGSSGETRILRQFPKGGPSLVWEVKKGSGYSAPVVAGDRVILFHRAGDEEVVECLRAETGQRFWRFAYPTGYQDRYGYCDGPRSGPAIDGGRVYAYGAEAKLHCLDLATGRVLWKRDLMAEFQLKQNFFGVGSSPLVEGGLVILNVGAPGGPCVAAFDARTGRLAWGAGDQWGPGYATPVPAVVRGKRRVFVFAGGESRPAAGGLLCIDPADGKVDFSFKWRSRRFESVNASSPLVVGDQVFISECYGAGGALLDVLPDGTARPAWTSLALGTHFMTAIHRGGYLYGVDGHGPLDAPLVCLELKTGKELWRTETEWEETLPAEAGPRKRKIGIARGQLMPVDGRVLCLGEYGHLLWVDLSPEGYKEVDRAWLFAAAETWAPPVLSRGLLYVCQNGKGLLRGDEPRLLCYDLRGE